MPRLSVRTPAVFDANSFASPAVVDFSDDIGPGEQILAYAVGLSGFTLDYQTTSLYWAEEAGALGVSLTPNLLGSLIAVSGNVMLTDFDGDTALAPGYDDNPSSMAFYTVLAVIGTPSWPSASAVCGTAFGLGAGKDSPPIFVGGGGNEYLPFLSGFSVAGVGGSTGPIGGLTLGASVSSPVADSVTVKGSATLSGFTTTGTVDVGLLSYVPEDLTGFACQTVDVTWGAVDGYQGITGTFTAKFDVPAGSSIGTAGTLLQGVNIVYDSVAEFQLLRAWTFIDDFGTDTVGGTVVLNIFNPDALAHAYISPDSTATVSVIAQIA